MVIWIFSDSAMNSTRDRRKAKGLCIDCGKSKAGDGVRCPSCVEELHSSYVKRYAARKASRRCTVCGFAVKPGRRKCEVCLNAASETSWQRFQALRDECVQLRAEVETLKAQLAQRGELCANG